jgi:sigma-E factor negative regulatory protein RseC
VTPARESCLAIEAIVRAVDSEGNVELEIAAESRCAGCAGACTWSRPSGPRRLKLKSVQAFEPGSVVRVTLPAEHVVTSALLLHGLPLAALLAGAWLGTLVAPSDLGTLVGALLGLGVALTASRGWRRRAEALTFLRATLEPRR